MLVTLAHGGHPDVANYPLMAPGIILVGVLIIATVAITLAVVNWRRHRQNN